MKSTCFYFQNLSKNTGTYNIPVRVYADVEPEIIVEVVAEEKACLIFYTKAPGRYCSLVLMPVLKLQLGNPHIGSPASLANSSLKTCDPRLEPWNLQYIEIYE